MINFFSLSLQLSRKSVFRLVNIFIKKSKFSVVYGKDLLFRSSAFFIHLQLLKSKHAETLKRAELNSDRFFKQENNRC